MNFQDHLAPINFSATAIFNNYFTCLLLHMVIDPFSAYYHY